jgi:hypothetical protein
MNASTRYDRGDTVKHQGKTYTVADIYNARSDSPDYLIAREDGQHKDPGDYIRVKASDINLAKGNWKDQAKMELEDKLNVETEKGSYRFYDDMPIPSLFLQSTSGEAVNGEQEWIVFKNREDAREAAETKVVNDLETEPGIYNESFLARHSYITDTDKRMIAQDDARVITEDRPKDELESMAEMKGISYSDDIGRDELAEKIRVKEKERIQEKLEDPIEYFVNERGIYSKEQLMEQGFIRLDMDSAAEDAVNRDGEAHFLDIYDGKAEELPSGAVAFATN